MSEQVRWIGLNISLERSRKSKVLFLSFLFGSSIDSVASPAKPSHPSRAYIHVISGDYIPPLAERVRQTSFLDARNTASDAVLLGPPSVEFAAFAKIPGTRVRKDARVGTIDQDPDFVAFLESLTQPVGKQPAPPPISAAAAPAESANESNDKNSEDDDTKQVTPLVQYLRDKKSNKLKDNTSKSHGRHGKGEKHDGGKSEKLPSKKQLAHRGDRESSHQTPAAAEKKQPKPGKATIKDKATNKNGAATPATKSGGTGPKSTATSLGPADGALQGSSRTGRRKDHGNTDASPAGTAKRDMGLGGRKGGACAEGTDGNASAPESGIKHSRRHDTSPAKGKEDRHAVETGAVVEAEGSSKSPVRPSKSGRGKQSTATTSSTTPTATQAFLKHANVSQGVTEQLLESEFGVFGGILKVEIDRKKGFGYIDFAEPQGLQKAIAASPVTVAQSQLVVLERRMKTGEKPRGKSQAGGGGGGGARARNSGGGEAVPRGGGRGGGAGRRGKGGFDGVKNEERKTQEMKGML